MLMVVALSQQVPMTPKELMPEIRRDMQTKCHAAWKAAKRRGKWARSTTEKPA